MAAIDLRKCIGCGMCARDCLPQSLEIWDGKAYFLEDHNCMQCGHCVAICPRGAVSIPELNMSEVVDLKDHPHQLNPDLYWNYVRSRRSIRAFRPDPVSEEQLDMLLNTGRFSPTGGNRQNVRYNIIRNRLPEFRKLVLEELNHMAMAGQGDSWYPSLWQDMYKSFIQDSTDRLFFDAPVVILVSSSVPQAACIASAHMETMANALDLGVLYSGFTVRAIANSLELQESLDLKEGYSVWTALVIGKPRVTYRRTVPRNAADVVWD